MKEVINSSVSKGSQGVLESALPLQVKINQLNWMIGGEAGYGIMNAALVFAKYSVRNDLFAFLSHEYPSLIRGGHNTSSVRVSEKDIASHDNHLDIVVALNKETIIRHLSQIESNGYLIYDGEQIQDINTIATRKDINLVPVPFLKISKQLSPKLILSNSIALGASLALTNSDLRLLNNILAEMYSDKTKEVIEWNIKSAKLGYDYVKSNFKGDYNLQLSSSQSKKQSKKYILSGNEAIVFGAITAGCKFVSQYPMTPTSQILTLMAKYSRDYNIVLLQPEDEISSIHMAIGATFAGIRAMTCTSGGGFDLMTEGFGLAGITELPVVIVVGQRGGPATGLPTKHEQSDLNMAVYSGHGEIARIVIAPAGVEDAFNSIQELFNLTEKFQVPGILLVDKYTCINSKTVESINLPKQEIERQIISQKELDKIQDFKRYNFSTLNGVSKRSIPGQKNGLYCAASDEHDEYGQLIDDSETRNKMMEKRLKKIIFIKQEFSKPQLIGNQNADITIVGWGSTKSAIQDAIASIQDSTDITLNHLHIKYMFPFQSEDIKSILEKSKRIIIIEDNYTAQLANLIREKTGIEIKNKILRFDGKQFTSEELHKKILVMLSVKR